MSNSSNSNSSTVLLDPPPSLSNLPLLPGNNPKSREYIPPPPPLPQTQSSPQLSVSQPKSNNNPLKQSNNVRSKQVGKQILSNPSQANIPNNAPKLNNNNRLKLSRNLSRTTNNISEPN